MNLIKDLWLGNVSESEHMSTSPEYRRLDDLADEQRTLLEQHLPPQHQELLDRYTDTMYSLSSVYAEDAFARGVSFGLRFACEAFFGKQS